MILGFVIFLNYSGISEGVLNGKNITLMAVFVTQLKDLRVEPQQYCTLVSVNVVLV